MKKPYRYAFWQWEWQTAPTGARERLWKWKGRSWWCVWFSQSELREFGISERSLANRFPHPTKLIHWCEKRDMGLYARTDGWRRLTYFLYCWKYARAQTLFLLKWKLRRHRWLT